MKNFRYSTFFGVGVIHLLSFFSFFYITWEGVLVSLVLYFLTGCLGVTFCYHRLLTHRGFTCNVLLRNICALLGCFALQGEPSHWVATHRVHHRQTDKTLDPHSPNKGFWWAHMFWVFWKHPLLKTQKQIELYTPDIYNDKYFTFLRTYYVEINTLLLFFLFVGGCVYGFFTQQDQLLYGASFLFLGGFLRAVILLHTTWFVNSAAHIWGYKNYPTKDNSKNLWWVALLTFGEGWHNNHHHKASLCRHGIKWWEFDLTYLIIKGLEKVKLVSYPLEPKI